LKKTISITVQPHYKRDDTLLYFFFIQNKIHKVEYTTIHYFQKKKINISLYIKDYTSYPN
jgi:hypothetical protein